MNILQINSSIRGTNSESSRVASNISKKLSSQIPGSTIAVRDLAENPHPPLDEFTLNSLSTPVEQRNDKQRSRIALDDSLIRELEAADVIVVGAPMYNFGISIQLKAWFDAVARVGVTFRYSESGPEGLLKNKKVFVATSRGGSYEQKNDPQESHMRMFFGFLGMNDVTFIYSNGQSMGPEGSEKGKSEANLKVSSLI